MNRFDLPQEDPPVPNRWRKKMKAQPDQLEQREMSSSLQAMG